MQLNASALDSWSEEKDQRVLVPTYDRKAVRVGIVHLGVGGFHRAHQAMYLDRLMNAGHALDFGICGVGIRDEDRRMREVMDEQDCLYTLVERAADGSSSVRVVGSIVRYLHGPEDPEAVLGVLTAPETRIVSLTITEGGYAVDPATGRFDEDDEAVQQDLCGETPPVTAFAYLVEALARRRGIGTPPFTIVSCDNIPHNGRVARAAVTGFARLRDPDLATWIDTSVSFPSSMVDRITPATSDADRDEIEQLLGRRDAWPVVCEAFAQWVLEDDFPAGRPPLQEVGVQLVEQAEPYEVLKLRVLNAGHQAIAHLGRLVGHRSVHEAANDPALAAFYRAYTEEVLPTLRPVDGIEVSSYRDEVARRFTNPAIGDSLDRICAFASDRIATFVLPAVRDNLAAGRDVRCAAGVVAAWARCAEGRDEDGTPLELVDPLADQLRARATDHDDLAFLGQREVFGDLVDEPAFTEAYLAARRTLRDDGARALVADLTRSRGQ